MAVLSFSGMMVYMRANISDMHVRWWAHVCFHVGAVLGLILMLMFVYSVCRVRIPRWWWLLLGLIGAAITITLLRRPGWQSALPLLSLTGVYAVGLFDLLRVLDRAIRRRQLGVWLIGVGASLTILVYLFAASDPFGV